MTTKFPATPTSKTHFEQIPVAVVKKIAALDESPGSAPARPDSGAVKPTSRRTRPVPDAGHFHGVQFYNDPDGLCRIVGGFIGEGIEQGGLAVIIATPDHIVRIESCLRRRGIDVDTLKRLGHLVALDANDTLQLFMTDGMPNPGAFRRTLGDILTDVRRGREHC